MTQATLTPKAEATRLSILDTGYRLVLRKGFSGVGLAEILSHSGVPKGSFYHYFPSKEAFGVALLQHYIDGYAARLDTLLAEPANGAGKLMRFWNAWISAPEGADAAGRLGWAEGCLVVKLSAEVADLSEEMRRVLATGVSRLIERIGALIDDGRADGSLPPGAASERLAPTLYQLWLGAALLARLARSPVPLEDALAATRALISCRTH